MITFHFHLQPQYKYELFHINFTYAVICWKLDRECHVDFCMFLTPHELNFELLMKTLKRKWKGMRKSCLVYCYSGIQSLFEVVLLYTTAWLGISWMAAMLCDVVVRRRRWAHAPAIHAASGFLQWEKSCVGFYFYACRWSCTYKYGVPLLYGSVSQGLGTIEFMNLICWSKIRHKQQW